MELSQKEINMWELEYFNRIVKWEKDFIENTIVFWLDDVKNGEKIHFKILNNEKE